MPSRWQVQFEIPDIRRTELHQLHGLVSHWLEGPLSVEDHHANRKPFCLSPLERVEGDVWRTTIGLLDDALPERLMEQVVATGGQIRLGGQQCRVVLDGDSPLNCIRAASWGALLAQASPQRLFTFTFLTPTTFRAGRNYQPLPAPSSVFGHYQAVWEAFGPPDSGVGVDLRDAGLFVDHLDGATAKAQVRRNTATGFVGTVTYRATLADPQVLEALDALAEIAEFSGTGAQTTHGLGVTERVR